MINEINFARVAGNFLNSKAIKEKIHRRLFWVLEICKAMGINLVSNNDIKMSNCTDTSCTIHNIATKEIRIAFILLPLNVYFSSAIRQLVFIIIIVPEYHSHL